MTRWVIIIIGLVLVAIGLLWPLIRRLGLGRLPGDIYLHGESWSFYFPFSTCVVISVVLSLLIWLLNR